MGLANAYLVGVPMHYGLYTEFCTCFIYSILTTSKQTSMGTTASTSITINQILENHMRKLNDSNCWQ